MSESMELIDGSKMALVVTVDSTGQARFFSGLGYSKRQQAEMLDTLAATARRRADADGEPAR